jgi:hypothetical protein
MSAKDCTRICHAPWKICKKCHINKKDINEEESDKENNGKICVG